jgi:hypothetical protein
VAARDREADALVGDAPDARRRRAWVAFNLHDALSRVSESSKSTL